MLELMHNFKMAFGSSKKPGVSDTVVWDPAELADLEPAPSLVTVSLWGACVGAGAVAWWALTSPRVPALSFVPQGSAEQESQGQREGLGSRPTAPHLPPGGLFTCPTCSAQKAQRGGAGRPLTVGFFFDFGSAVSEWEALASLEE